MFENLNFNLWNVLIFSGIVQGILFSCVVLFNKKYKSTTNQFIVFTVLALSLSNLQYWLMDTKIITKGDFLFEMRIPFDFLIVPTFYIYVSHYLKENLSNKIKILLVSPFLLGVIIHFLIYFNLNSVAYLDGLGVILEYLSLLLTILLIGLILFKINSYEEKNKLYDSKSVKIETKWLKRILYIGGLLCIFWFAETIYVQTKYHTGLDSYYPLWLSISFLVYWISYVGIFHSKIYNERQIIREQIAKAKEYIKPIKKSLKKSNEKLFLEITSWITRQKIYVNPSLSISLVSEKFNVSNGYISQLWSSHCEQNFNDYINLLRVNEAKKMLENLSYENYTILAIAYESGFNSKSSFYSSFKKFTNKTPIQYKKDVRNS